MRLLGRSEIEQELTRKILMETCLLLFSSFYRISTCLGDLELDSSGVIFVSLDWKIYRDIYRSIMGSIGISGVLL